MLPYRTDLAMEARELWEKSTERTSALSGVKAEEREEEGYRITRVDILDEEGAEALGKPIGSYRTVDISPCFSDWSGSFPALAALLGRQLQNLLPADGPVFAAGLGNRRLTPDAIGPLAVEGLLITRHLSSVLPGFRPLSAAAAGVLGTTGLESGEWVRALAERSEAEAVIVIDALAAREQSRLCAAIQFSDTGIIPGSGVGNARMALNRESLGVPVIAVGVPTVVDTRILSRDGTDASKDGFFVTPRDVDERVRRISRLISYAVNLALQPELSVEEIAALTE